MIVFLFSLSYVEKYDQKVNEYEFYRLTFEKSLTKEEKNEIYTLFGLKIERENGLKQRER